MRPLFQLNHYFWKYRRLFLPGLLCAVASSIFAVVVPVVVRKAVDTIPDFVTTYQHFASTSVGPYLYGQFFTTLLLYGVLILVLSLISGLFTFLMRQTVVVASRHIEFDLRNRLYEHLQTLPQHFYHRFSTGDVITRATSDIEHVRRYIGPAIMYFTRAITLVATAVVVMLIISPRLTLYALIPMPFLALSVFFLAHLVNARSDAIQKQYAILTSRVQEAFSGIRVLKAYTREEGEARAFENESAHYQKRMLDLAFVDSIWRPVFLVLVGMSTIIVVWVGGRLVMEGLITIGNIAEYMIYVALMTWPVASMGYVITMVQRGAASMVRLNDIFHTHPDIADDGSTDASVNRIEGRITFENVGYAYEGAGAPALADIVFDLPAGRTLAIVGRTGSGKSTLVDMIPRLLEPTSGRVLIDGRDVREIPLHVLRSA
ncbi:MAG TPA: ABC transporter transmembrane domain-containing protein, partial [Rhodothermales bacterium]